MWYCNLPWTGFSNDPDGRVRPCCLFRDHIKKEDGTYYYVQKDDLKEIFSSQYMQELRQEFREGKKPANCEVCIIDEQNGYKSKRMRYQKTDIIYAEEPSLPVEYQMILSNACNLKCRSCTPSHSNLWQAEHKQIWGHIGYDMPHGQSGDKNSVLWENRNEWLSHVERLEIVGGEPFYIKQWRDLWIEMIDKDLAKNISMDMSSNAVIYGGDVIEKLVEHFKSVGLGLSIDGIGKTYNYLRHPAKWEDVEKNILLYKQLEENINSKNFGISVSHTISWINAWELPEFHDYFKYTAPRFKIWNNIVHRPKHMSLTHLPQTAKDKIYKKWKKYNWGVYKTDIEGIISFMYSIQPSTDEIKEVYKMFPIHDEARNESTIDIVPNKLKKCFRGILNEIS